MNAKRILALLLLVCLLLPTLVACGTTTEPPAPEESSSAEESTTTIETNTPPKAEPFSLVVDGKTEYSVIRGDMASQTIIDAAVNLRKDLNAITGATFGLGNDFVRPNQPIPEVGYEILVGTTNRVECENATALIREKDFIIYEENRRIIIMGGTDEKTLEAIEYFMENYVDREGKNVTLLEGTQEIVRYSYTYASLKIGENDISKYTVIIPKGDTASSFAYYAALNFIDFIKAEAGITLTLADDSTPAGDFEIVIGETSRAGSVSAANTTLAADSYILKQVGSSLYMYGKSYMVGGGVSELVNNYMKTTERNANVVVTGVPTTDTPKQFVFPDKADSAILLIGDGMGFNHIEASEIVGGLSPFLGKELPAVGSSTTYSQSVTAGNAEYTDSAASATALATGYKTYNKYLGVDKNKRTVQNVRELASESGARTGVLTTDVITGATPSGFICHHTDRNDADILSAQIENKLKSDENFLYATSVKSNHDLLVPEARKMLYDLAEGGSTIFAMIESAYIDKHSHSNDLNETIQSTILYNAIIGYCVQFVMLHPTTALVITADHECGGLSYTPSKGFYYTSEDHTNVDVPLYAIGPKTEYFHEQDRDNTEVAKFIAAVFSDKTFGDPSFVKQ